MRYSYTGQRIPHVIKGEEAHDNFCTCDISARDDTPNFLGEQWVVVEDTRCSACNLIFALVRSSRVEGNLIHDMRRVGRSWNVGLLQSLRIDNMTFVERAANGRSTTGDRPTVANPLVSCIGGGESESLQSQPDDVVSRISERQRTTPLDFITLQWSDRPVRLPYTGTATPLRGPPGACAAGTTPAAFMGREGRSDINHLFTNSPTLIPKCSSTMVLNPIPAFLTMIGCQGVLATNST